MYFPGTSAQINKHCSCRASSRPARPSVRPSPPPLPFHPRPRAPSKLHYPASTLRASGSGNNFPKNRKRKERGVRTQPHPSVDKESSPGRELCLWCFPVSNQVTTPQTHPLPSSPPSTDRPPAASRRPLLPRRPCRPTSAPQDVDLTRRARLGGPGRGGRGAGEEGRFGTRASTANPHSASAPAGHNFTAAG